MEYFTKIKKIVKTKDDYDLMMMILMDRIFDNKPISANGMLDGSIIAFMISVKFTRNLFTGDDMGRVLDGTIQKLEQIIIWVNDNEKKIVDIIKADKRWILKTNQ